MSVVRMNITLPQDLAEELEKIARIKADEIQRFLEEGYKARREESHAITKEFEAVDLEGWDKS